MEIVRYNAYKRNYCCEMCGATDSAQFKGKYKTICKQCQYKQARAKIKPCCKKCGATDSAQFDEKHKTICKQCQSKQALENKKRYKAYQKAWKKNNPTYHRKWAYGLNDEEYSAMLEAQQGKCKICNQPPKGRKPLHTDHDHVTGKVRGLLCMNCNQGLGLFHDNPQFLRFAAEYLEQQK